MHTRFNIAVYREAFLNCIAPTKGRSRNNISKPTGSLSGKRATQQCFENGIKLSFCVISDTKNQTLWQVSESLKDKLVRAKLYRLMRRYRKTT